MSCKVCKPILDGEKLEQQNKRYREVIRELNYIVGEAIESIDIGEDVNGLEYAIKTSYEALEESK